MSNNGRFLSRFMWKIHPLHRKGPTITIWVEKLRQHNFLSLRLVMNTKMQRSQFSHVICTDLHMDPYYAASIRQVILQLSLMGSRWKVENHRRNI